MKLCVELNCAPNQNSFCYTEITPHSAEPLDLSQPDETEFDGPPAKVSRPDSMTTSTPAKSAHFLKPDNSHNACISQEMFWKFHPNQPVSNILFNSAVVYDRQDIQGIWTLMERWWHTMKKTRLCIARFVWYMLPRKVKTCRWRAVLTGDTTSQQDWTWKELLS